LSVTLPSLLVIPIGLAIVKRAADSIPKDTTPIVPIIPTLPKDIPLYDDLILRQKDKPVVVTPIIPTGPIKQPSADIPKFVPFELLGSGGDASGLKGLPDFGNLPTNFFQTGIFDPAVQAKLRAKK
jgi:hypothetical protein